MKKIHFIIIILLLFPFLFSAKTTDLNINLDGLKSLSEVQLSAADIYNVRIFDDKDAEYKEKYNEYLIEKEEEAVASLFGSSNKINVDDSEQINIWVVENRLFETSKPELFIHNSVAKEEDFSFIEKGGIGFIIVIVFLLSFLLAIAYNKKRVQKKENI